MNILLPKNTELGEVSGLPLTIISYSFLKGTHYYRINLQAVSENTINITPPLSYKNV